MSLVLSEDEQLIASTLRKLLARSAPVTAFRAMRDAKDPDRTMAALWTELTEAGYGTPHLPQVGMGYIAAGIVAEEMGRTLAATPFHSTAIAIELLQGSGHARAEEEIARLATGESIAVLALEEGVRHSSKVEKTRAVRDGDGYRLGGSKRFVVDGGIATLLVVAARLDDKHTALFLVDPKSAGVRRTPLDLVDSRNAVSLHLDGVRVGKDALLSEGEAATRSLEHALDVGRILLSAELLGIAQECFDRTVEYLKEREQFGVKIGSFQALQHRTVRMHIALEIARAVVVKALRALDEKDPSVPALASLAKTALTRTARDVVHEAMHMHGGIGVTDELDLGFFYKRARVAGETLGDDGLHKERLARLVWRV